MAKKRKNKLKPNMNPRLARWFLKIMGWKAIEPLVPEEKCIILGAPHTSIWDFPVSLFYYSSLGGRAYVMIKKEFFFWPLGPVLRRLGGIPVAKGKGAASLVRQIINAFEEYDHLHLALAPEGTRKAVERWKTGFHTIAKATNVPVYLGYFDWGKKEVGRGIRFELTDDPQADLKRVRQWYKEKGVVGKHPEMFSTGSDLA